MEEVDILGSINFPKIMRLYRFKLLTFFFEIYIFTVVFRVFADLEHGLNDDIVLILEYLSGRECEASCLRNVSLLQAVISTAG